MNTSTSEEQYSFVSSAAMMPGDIRLAYPRASFVARGWLAVQPDDIDAYFRDAVQDRVWGLLLAGIEHESMGRSAVVTSDDGKTYNTVLTDTPLLSGDPEQVLASARYWELPPPFIAQLRRALENAGIAVVDEEPRDDGNLG